MSKSKNPIKVLKTAYNRLEKGWEKGDWHYRDSDGNNYVCIEGALYGFCTEPKTEAQRIAGKTVEQIKTVIGCLVRNRSVIPMQWDTTYCGLSWGF